MPSLVTAGCTVVVPMLDRECLQKHNIAQTCSLPVARTTQFRHDGRARNQTPHSPYLHLDRSREQLRLGTHLRRPLHRPSHQACNARVSDCRG